MGKKEEKMSFLKKTVLSLKNVALLNLMTLLLMFNCVLADVFHIAAPNPAVINNNIPNGGVPVPPGSFTAYIGANTAVNGTINNVALNGLFPGGIGWEMPGFVAFIPNGGGAASVYVGKKRIGPGTAINDPMAGGNLLSYNSDIHTERQLAIVALEEGIGGVALPQVGGLVAAAPALGHLAHNAKIPHVNAAIPVPGGGVYALAGTLHIYTGRAPCQHRAPAVNTNFSCIEYYNQLAVLFPAVQFHIYFPAHGMRFTEVAVNAGGKATLMTALNGLMVRGGAHFRVMPVMQVDAGGGVWLNIQDTYDAAAAGAAVWTAIPHMSVVQTINSHVLSQPVVPANLNAMQRGQLFTDVYNPALVAPNIRYHAI
jgi:hypothetical protein